jgi:gamma-glutamyl:cysteine ligase YbdK (ATP-grasp superfamily)
MHPLLKLEETSIWTHRHRQIYEAYARLFNLHQHGWLNIQSFQLNLPYATEQDGVKLHNLLANIIPHLPAITASSPIYESKFGNNVDNRLHFYRLNQHEISSVTGDIIPEYVSSLSEYRHRIIEKYSSEMARAGADKRILHKDWVNSRGIIFRFDRRAVETRVMDEQDCIKSDVAVSCFIRALLRGLLDENPQLLPYEVLVKDYDSVVAGGLRANPSGRPARAVCQTFYEKAWKNASKEEKKYLSLVKKRIDKGNLSEIIHEAVQKKAQKTSFKEAVISVYSKLSESLIQNQPYF